MERTQIYLTTAQSEELDRRARRQGTTRSHLIREAVEQYLGPAQWDAEAFKVALRDVAGMWADRDDLDELYAGMRQASIDKMAQLYPDYGSEADDVDDRR